MNTKKILIIGQSLPAVKQNLPYDTTMLYDWLGELGISKDEAQVLFEFEAVYGYGFLGYDSKGGHIIPTKEHKDKYFKEVLADKIAKADKVWVLGRVAEKYLKEVGALKGKVSICTIHPSTRNYSLYIKNKQSILKEILSLL